MHLTCTILLTLAAAATQPASLRVSTASEIGKAAQNCAETVTMAGIKPLRSGWVEKFRSAENGSITYSKSEITLTIAALPGFNMCAIRARTMGDSQFGAITRAVGKSLHAKDAMQTWDSLSAKRSGEAYFDTKTHSVTLSATQLDGGPGIQISFLPKR